MKRLIQILVIGALVALSTTLASAQVPQMINYQGKLTTSAGAPVNDTVQMVFSIYADAGGATLLWTETQTAVIIEKGVFNVLLGSVSSIPYSVFYGSIRYLGVKVGDDPEITPRKPMVSVAYAYKSFEVDTADYARNGAGDNDWDIIGDVLFTHGAWGIARYGNMLWGSADSTHVNLGVACTTGTSGQNYKYCTVGGGFYNTASFSDATVSGGRCNYGTGQYSTVSGGSYNFAIGGGANIGGGTHNSATALLTTVGGGHMNDASDAYATVAGGRENDASGTHATVAGGGENDASGTYATVSGGATNTASEEYSTVGGGFQNTASGGYATAGGGVNNNAWGGSVTVGGGASNTAIGNFSTVGGGYRNIATTVFPDVDSGSTVGGGADDTASGSWATVPGGRANKAAGDYSFAAGRRAKAIHDGSFVWGDGTNADFASTGANQFLIRASGGVGIGLSNPNRQLYVVENVSGVSYPLKIDNPHSTFGTDATGILFSVGGQGSHQLETNRGKGALVYEYTNTWNRGDFRFLQDANPDSANHPDLLDAVMTITNGGKVGIGTPSPQGALDVSSTTGALIVPRMTTAQRDALTPVNGMIIYNTSTNQFNFRENGAWVIK